VARPFNEKQQRFIEVYDGNGTHAAAIAGYSGTENALAVRACLLLRNEKIRQAIQNRRNDRLSPFIMSREDRQRMWSQVAMDCDADMKNRLKASELLGKSQADFTERIEIDGSGIADRLQRATDRVAQLQRDRIQANADN